jgi:hypothetical protein
MLKRSPRLTISFLSVLAVLPLTVLSCRNATPSKPPTAPTSGQTTNSGAADAALQNYVNHVAKIEGEKLPLMLEGDKQLGHFNIRFSRRIYAALPGDPQAFETELKEAIAKTDQYQKIWAGFYAEFRSVPPPPAFAEFARKYETSLALLQRAYQNASQTLLTPQHVREYSKAMIAAEMQSIDAQDGFAAAEQLFAPVCRQHNLTRNFEIQ